MRIGSDCQKPPLPSRRIATSAQIRDRSFAVAPVARRAAGFLSRPPVLAVLAGLCFLAITYWWLRVDTRGPDNDAGRHLNYAWNYFQDMRDGDPFSWFTEFD